MLRGLGAATTLPRRVPGFMHELQAVAIKVGDIGRVVSGSALPGDGHLNLRAVRTVLLGDGRRAGRSGSSFPPDDLGVFYILEAAWPFSTAPCGSIPSPATGSTCRRAGSTALRTPPARQPRCCCIFAPVRRER